MQNMFSNRLQYYMHVIKVKSDLVVNEMRYIEKRCFVFINDHTEAPIATAYSFTNTFNLMLCDIYSEVFYKKCKVQG